MKNKNKEKKKFAWKNISIPTRLTITTLSGIGISIILIGTLWSVFFNTMATYFDISSVTTSSYSMLNQLQWNQALSSISNELAGNDSNEKKIEELKKFVSPIEALGSQIYIECNNEKFYSSSQKNDILQMANSITPINTAMNTNYFGENGIVIVSHCESKDNRYLVLIASDNYTVNDVNSRNTAQDFTSLTFGKTGIIVLIMALIFITIIASLSVVTAKVINKPLKQLDFGANQIAGGNLDYRIDYESKNELGTVVNAFNNMAEKLRESIEEKNEMQESRKEMIAGVAHDLRTPLTSVKGYVEGLMDGIANTPEKQERYLKTIYSSTKDMERLLDELLTISRLELGKIQLITSPVNINDFLDDCAEDISTEMEKQGFDFIYDNACEREAVVELDVDRFSRVLTNIISNSIKYKKPNVKGKIEISAQSYEKSVIISIADNGIGVDSQTLPKIFDSFYRADKARSNVANGSGIGLSVCKQIVELHGGHIWATGREGEGLTILISLQKRMNDNEQENFNR